MEEMLEEEKTPFILLKESLDPTSINWRSKTSASIINLIRSPVFPWFVVFILLCNTVIYRATHTVPYEVIWTETDFVPARKSITNKLVKFSSGLDFLDTKGHTYRIYNPDEPVYVGNDSNVDRNWELLIMPDYNEIKISAEERKLVDGDLFLFPDDTYTIALSVFHNPHCLNTIRKRVYSDIYPHMLGENARFHVDHCLEALREMIMCGGDMTPIPFIWSENGETDNPDFPIVHSCRDFDQLREWMVSRGSSNSDSY